MAQQRTPPPLPPMPPMEPLELLDFAMFGLQRINAARFGAEYCSINEAAALLQCSRSTVKKLLRDDELLHCKRGHRILIERKSIAQYAQRPTKP